MRLPSISQDECASVLEKVGFSLSRIKGSHYIFWNAVGDEIVVPYRHSLKQGTLRLILRKAGISDEQFYQLRSKG